MNRPDYKSAYRTQISKYYQNLSPSSYIKKINSPSNNPAYYEQFHKPIIEGKIISSENGKIKILDIACGYGNEIKFFSERKDVEIQCVDISPKAINQIKNRFPQITAHVSDVRNEIPIKQESIDVAMLVNAMIYSPVAMLKTAKESLKKGGKLVVNFKDSKNPDNQKHYQYYLDRGGVMVDKRFKFNGRYFDMKEMDYTNCNDESIHYLGKQIYFQGTQNIERFIRSAEFKINNHHSFYFNSLTSPRNQVDVYCLEKE
jgi:SAM-dependent methyltransferase